MDSINISQTLIIKRGELGITQHELAQFIGVSKASVSKWEKGHSYPDITLLPKLAAYFDVSLDELMGYEPQLTDEMIHSLTKELLQEFALKSFNEAKKSCDVVIKKHYSCFPLLYKVGTLFMNYGLTVEDDVQRIAVIKEAKDLFVRVKTLCDTIELKQFALQSEAVCELMLGNAANVSVLLEKERTDTYHPSIGVLLAQSYQMTGKTEEAKSTLQNSLFDSIISFIYDATVYLTLCKDNPSHFEAACKRTIYMVELFHVPEIFPIAVLPLYLSAAEGYIEIGENEKCLAMLEQYAKLATGPIFPLTIKSDNFFTCLNSPQYGQTKELPRDEYSLKQEMVDAVTSAKVFSSLQENQRYQTLASNLGKLIDAS